MRTCKGKEVRSLEQRSLKDPNNFSVKSPIWSTWMSSSLLANSDTKTFFPSAIRVRDTQSLPEARRWASSGSFSSRESLTVRSRLKVGWKTPKVCFLASFAVVKISAHNCSEGENGAEPNVQANVENQWHYDVSLHYPHLFFIAQQLFSSTVRSLDLEFCATYGICSHCCISCLCVRNLWNTLPSVRYNTICFEICLNFMNGRVLQVQMKKRQKFHTKIQRIAINMNYVTQNVFIYSTRHVEIK